MSADGMCSHNQSTSAMALCPDGTRFPIDCPGTLVECFARALWQAWWRSTAARKGMRG